MKIPRVLFAVSLAMLAAAPPLASAGHAAIPPPPSKPPPEGARDSDREAWRGQAVGLCVGEIRTAMGVTPDERELACGCAVDRFMTGVLTDALPALAPSMVRSSLGSPLLACATDQRPAVAAAIARRLAEPPTEIAPPPEGKPPATQVPDADGPRERPGAELRSWFEGLSLPTWVTDSGLPLWAWIVLCFLGLAFLRALFRGGDSRDLIGPPPSMRLGTRHNPPEPRRADPPQRS